MKKSKLKVLAIAVCAGMLISTLGKVNVLSENVYADSVTLPESGPHGSGSYQLNSVPGDYRYYTEYYVGAASGKSFTTAGIERRTTIKVYAKAGEYILFGSSVSDSEINANNEWTRAVTGDDIVITKPDGTRVSEDVIKPGDTDKEGHTWPNGHGYIANPTQEKYGPMVNHADETDPEKKYYVPITYQIPADGVYTFEFHSKTGYNDGTTPSPKLASATDWSQNKTSVAAWDVTVLGTNTEGGWEVKEGRAWADYLALSTGDAGTKISDLNVHVLTHDGFVYKVNFERAVPFGFIFFANNTGFMTTASDAHGNVTVSPIYHSFYDSTNDLDHMTDGENIILHKPNQADTETEETYKIFFNRPSSDLDGVTYMQNGSVITMKTEPDDVVTISEPVFTGIKQNIAHSGMGGTFTFNSSGEAMISIRIDLRKAIFESIQNVGSYEGSGLIEITTPVHEGDNIIYWDGKDTDGVVVPAGIYGNQNVVLSTEIKRGELHFPVIDSLYTEGTKTNVIEITNSQVFDDRAYYVWLDHQTSLPDLVSQTYVEDGERKSHAVTLIKDEVIKDGEYRIKGLSVTSMDAVGSSNSEGNATDAFRIKENSTNALFTATNHGNYKTGTGTRTYQVKYVVDSATKSPVSIKVNDDKKLVLRDNESVLVEGDASLIVYSWYMTIHVYDVKPDGVFEYDPADGDVILQKALDVGYELEWELIHDSENENSVIYKSTDPRTKGLLANDIYRVPLYKKAIDPDMGSCADILGIAYAGSAPVDDISELVFMDTYDSRYGLGAQDLEEEETEDGKATAYGSRGSVTVSLNTLRNTRINRTQDHANYADVVFTPQVQGKAKSVSDGVDVFYYKVAVFGEDSTYQFYQYEDMDASEGVVMYTYFTMKSLYVEPPTEEPPAEEDPPVEDPPTEEDPPVEDPPTEEDPPVEDPPAEEDPPVEEPPAEEDPPVEDLPTDKPPVDDDPFADEHNPIVVPPTGVKRLTALYTVLLISAMVSLAGMMIGKKKKM